MGARWEMRWLLEEREPELSLETYLGLGLPQKHAEGPPNIGHSLLAQYQEPRCKARRLVWPPESCGS